MKMARVLLAREGARSRYERTEGHRGRLRGEAGEYGEEN
jgi:hypothetical protein